MTSHVKLRHPKTGGEWLCPAEAVDDWLAKGWQRADSASAAAKNTMKEKPNG